MVDTHRVTGAARELAGKAQGAVGDVVGSRNDAVESRFRAAQGSADYPCGQAWDGVRYDADRAQDYAEVAGDTSGRHLREGRRAVVRGVEEGHLAALPIVGAVGYGLALLVRSRR